MKGNEIRKKFLRFFAERNHEVIPSAPLVPENDPTVLFNTAGMQPLVPYLLGQPHPTGAKRIASAQKCLRTNDIDEVGDNTHLTFFEMLGNWSLGDYFKEDAIKWSFEFITSDTEGLGLQSDRLYVTVFVGDDNAPKDMEAYNIWKDIFTAEGLDPEKRIFFMDAEANWWSPGDNGPCGPDSEMFYDVTGKLTKGLTHEEFIAADDRQDVVEIWNDVFMEYEKVDGKVVGKLSSQNVDTGSGLERIAAMVQGVDNVFDTDLFTPITNKITSLATRENPPAVRIIADHVRASVFLISDGVTPANSDQGYILRRLLRRSILQADKLSMPEHSLQQVAEVVIENYHEAYPNLKELAKTVLQSIRTEEEQFRKTLKKGLSELNRLAEKLKSESSEAGANSLTFTGKDLFDLYQTYGFPFELSIEELAKQPNIGTLSDEDITPLKKEFYALMDEHRAKSRAGAGQRFKGGLADDSDIVVQYHTATHLMLAALREILGSHVHQAGSNITTERMRFDFTHPEKIDRSVLDKIEEWVNNALKIGGTVTTEIVPKDEAKNDPTVEGSFWEKYPAMVTIYTMTGADGQIFSRELCGGPHVTTFDEINGTFSITKEESSSAGVRRIKATLK